MKKLLIMGLTLTAFALISCGKSKDKDPDEDGATAGDETTAGADTGADAPGATEYTITNNHNLLALSVVSGSDSLELATSGGCAKIKADQFATLKVSFSDTWIMCDSTNMMAAEDNVATPNANEATTPNKDDDCTAGNYIAAKDRNLISADAMNDSADCKALGGTAEPAGDATPAEDGEGTDG